MQVAVFFALGGAILLALRDIFGRLAMRGIDPVLGTAATALVGQVLLAVISAVNGDFTQPWPAWGLPLLNIALAGILRITIAAAALPFGRTRGFNPRVRYNLIRKYGLRDRRHNRAQP